MKSNRNTIGILALLALAAIGIVGLMQGRDQPRFEFQAIPLEPGGMHKTSGWAAFRFDPVSGDAWCYTATRADSGSGTGTEGNWSKLGSGK